MTVIIFGGLIVLCLYLYSQIPPKEIVQPFLSKFPTLVSNINSKLSSHVSGADIRTIILSGSLDDKYEFKLSLRYTEKKIIMDLNITDNIHYDTLRSTDFFILDSAEAMSNEIVNFVLDYHKREQVRLKS